MLLTLDKARIFAVFRGSLILPPPHSLQGAVRWETQGTRLICRFWKHSGSWIGCEFWRGFRIMPVLMFLNKIWITNLSSALVGMLMSSSKLFPFSNEAQLNSGVRLLLELYCYSHQACCLFYYFCEINNGIHIYQFTFKLLHFCFRMWLWFRI